ncbi:MAG: PAS domain S-box protein [Phycisphaerae bacterium]|nr:PAS domain S-box protein [Phycisphaerae bacterium]
MRWGYAKARQHRPDGIPGWVGLSLTGLYLGVSLALGAVSLWSHRLETQAQERDFLLRQTFWLARAVGNTAQGESYDAAVSELRRARQDPSIRRCEIVGRDGRILASTEQSRVGKALSEELAGRLIGVADVEAVSMPLESEGEASTVAIRLRKTAAPARAASGPTESAVSSPTSKRPVSLAWLVVEGARAKGRGEVFAWWASIGYVALAGMGLFWVLYRAASRALRPMATIRERLLSSGDQIAEQLATMRVNDSMDQAAAAWNRLIEFANDMQEEMRSAHLRTAVESTLDGYRSERLAAVLRQMPHGVLIAEDDGKIAFANRSASRMLGMREEDLAGREVREVLPEPISAGVLSVNRGPSRWTDHTLEGTEGSTTIRFMAVALEKAAVVSGKVIFLQDVSQFKEVERAQDDFLYHVTHELRTPLTNIRAYAETLAGGVLDDPVALRECYNVISGETERLGRLVEGILSVSQLEVGSARLSFGEVYADRMVRDAVQDMQAQAEAKGIDLRLRLPPKLPVIRGDKERLAAVMANLVGNAVKYTPSGGHVEVSCVVEKENEHAQGPGVLRISVSDTGVGIDEAHHEKIFEKFYRVHDERVEAEPGTGLGLAIVKETIRLHGGNVTVESTLGRGSTFHVTLPVSNA